MLALAGYPLGLRCSFLDRSADAPGAQVAPILVGAARGCGTARRAGLAQRCGDFRLGKHLGQGARAAGEIDGDSPAARSPGGLAGSTAREGAVHAPEDSGRRARRGRHAGSSSCARPASSGIPACSRRGAWATTARDNSWSSAPSRSTLAWEHDRRAGSDLREISGDSRARCRSSARAPRPATSCTIHCPRTPMPAAYCATALRPYANRAPGAQRQSYLRRVMRALDYVGVLAIEFFVVNGRLIANEMAPRVHNSGHWTIEGLRHQPIREPSARHLRSAARQHPRPGTRRHDQFSGTHAEPRAAAGDRRPGISRLWQGAAAGPQTGPLHDTERRGARDRNRALADALKLVKWS